ncbi:MAG: hypothetical protein ACFFDN_17590 [Candidatus Hodarchaeota archaeon]
MNIPAFPNSARPHVDVYSEGLTLLDFFASQAPNEIPEWFEHKELSKPESFNEYKFIKENDPDGDLRLNDILAYQDDPEFNEFVEPTAEANGLINDIYKHRKIAENKYLEWMKANQRFRYFQWRWYYAKMMLQERQNWIGGSHEKEEEKEI